MPGWTTKLDRDTAAGTVRSVERDPEGSFVAVRDGEVVGMAEAVRRGAVAG